MTEVDILKRRDQSDPKEMAIKDKIRRLLELSEWAPEAMREVHALQRDALREALQRLEDREHVRALTGRTYRAIAEKYRAHFADEESLEQLRKLPKGMPAIVATNHLGLYKVCPIETREIGVDMEGYPSMYPFWAYSAGLQVVADELECDLTYVSNQFPGVFHDLHQAAGFVHVAVGPDRGALAGVERQVVEIIDERPATLIVYFPEGTTSGKPNESDPYHLARYRRGAYAIAHDTEIPRILVAQFFHPERGLMVKVLDVSHVPMEGDSHEVCADYAMRDQEKKQEWLDMMVREHTPSIHTWRVFE